MKAKRKVPAAKCFWTRTPSSPVPKVMKWLGMRENITIPITHHSTTFSK